MNDERLETELRSYLAERDPGAAPATLHRVVREVPTRVGRPAERWRVAQLLAPLATGVAAVAVVVVIALIGVGRPAPVGGPNATVAPTASAAIAVLVPGDGVAEVQANEGPVLILIAIGVALFWLIVPARGHRRRALGIGLAVVVVGGIVSVANIQALAYRDGAMGVKPVTTVSPNPDLYPESDAYVMDVQPNELFPVVVTVTNVSPLPIVLLGLSPPPDGGVSVAPRFVAIGLLSDPGTIDLDQPPSAFHPTTLAPGGQLDVYLLASAGPCASRDDSFARYLLQEVDLVYEILWVRKTGSVALPTDIAIPARDGCTG